MPWSNAFAAAATVYAILLPCFLADAARGEQSGRLTYLWCQEEHQIHQNMWSRYQCNTNVALSQPNQMLSLSSILRGIKCLVVNANSINALPRLFWFAQSCCEFNFCRDYVLLGARFLLFKHLCRKFIFVAITHFLGAHLIPPPSPSHYSRKGQT